MELGWRMDVPKLDLHVPGGTSAGSRPTALRRSNSVPAKGQFGGNRDTVAAPEASLDPRRTESLKPVPLAIGTPGAPSTGQRMIAQATDRKNGWKKSGDPTKTDYAKLTTDGGKYVVTEPGGVPSIPVGRYIFVMMKNGDVRLEPHKGNGLNGHFALSGQALECGGAGELTFDDAGKLVTWNHESGTYRPPNSVAGQTGFPLDRFEPHFEPAGQD